MGCDIHVYLEIQNEDGSWSCVNPGYFNIKTKTYHPQELDLDRSYYLFAGLADVRNYDRLPAFSEPLGLPDDCSDVTLKAYNDWDIDGHSHSVIYMDELNTYKEMLTEKIETTKNKEQKHNLAQLQGDLYRFWMTVHHIFFMTGNRRSSENNPERIVFWFDN